MVQTLYMDINTDTTLFKVHCVHFARMREKIRKHHFSNKLNQFLIEVSY